MLYSILVRLVWNRDRTQGVRGIPSYPLYSQYPPKIGGDTLVASCTLPLCMNCHVHTCMCMYIDVFTLSQNHNSFNRIIKFIPLPLLTAIC